MRRFSLLSALVGILALVQPGGVRASEFNRISSTYNGLSGLFITQSIDTLPPAKVEVGFGLSYEDGKNLTSNTDLKVTELTSTLTVGVTPSIEVSAQLPYYLKVEDAPVRNDDSELGVANLSAKWRFLEPNTELNFPGFALSLTFYFPTGDQNFDPNTVDSWGLKALVVSSAEAAVGTPNASVLIGFYADGGIYIQDSGDPTEEQHGIIDLGLLIPLIESRELQLILEGNGRTKRNTFIGNEYAAATIGLRYVSRHLAVNGGYQYRVGQSPFDDSNLLIFYGSYFF